MTVGEGPAPVDMHTGHTLVARVKGLPCTRWVLSRGHTSEPRQRAGLDKRSTFSSATAAGKCRLLPVYGEKCRPLVWNDQQAGQSMTTGSMRLPPCGKEHTGALAPAETDASKAEWFRDPVPGSTHPQGPPCGWSKPAAPSGTVAICPAPPTTKARTAPSARNRTSRSAASLMTLAVRASAAATSAAAAVRTSAASLSESLRAAANPVSRSIADCACEISSVVITANAALTSTCSPSLRRLKSRMSLRMSEYTVAGFAGSAIAGFAGSACAGRSPWTPGVWTSGVPATNVMF
jgi:hypothetical protein